MLKGMDKEAALRRARATVPAPAAVPHPLLSLRKTRHPCINNSRLAALRSRLVQAVRSFGKLEGVRRACLTLADVTMIILAPTAVCCRPSQGCSYWHYHRVFFWSVTSA